MSNVPKISSDTAKGYATIIVVLAVVILAFIIVRKVFGGFSNLFGGISTGLGLSKTDAELAVDKKIEGATQGANQIGSPWSPQYYKNLPTGVSATLVTNATAKDIAKQLWESVSYVLPDTPAQGIAAIKRVPTKAALSYVVDIFAQTYNRDLYPWLVEWYNLPYQREYLAQIVDYVNSLPPYKRP